MDQIMVYDGRALRALSVGQLQRVLLGQEIGDANVTETDAYDAVPWLYRGVNLRADNVAAMPYTLTRQGQGQEVTNGPWVEQFEARLYDLLWLVEASLCLYGAAYWLVETNQLGLNPTPRWVVPTTMVPQKHNRRGLTGFERHVGGKTISLTLDQVVWWWIPSLVSEVGPGTSPARSALAAAGVLRNADRMVAEFFKRGAIKVTLLKVPKGPPPTEVKKLEAWWKRLISGIGRAYRAIGIRADVEPVVIGSDLKEADAGDLTERKREDVAVALGVPMALLFQSSAYATGRHEDRLAFITQTVIPECARIAGPLNEFLARLDLTLEFHPERLEVMQTAQLSQAQAVQGLVEPGEPLLSREEGRELLGYGPWPGSEPEPEEPEPARALTPAALSDLRRWRSKAGKRGAGVAFESAAIPPHVASALRTALDLVGQDAFLFLRAQDASRDEVEARLRRKIEKVLKEHFAPFLDAILDRQNPAYDELRDDLFAAAGPALAAIAAEEALRLAAEVGVQFDPAIINQAAVEWARRYGFNLVTGLTDTTRQAVSQAVEQFVATPGMTREALEELLSPTFGPVRAEMIAVTEVTRAYSAATSQYQVMLSESGIEMVRYWQTRNDEIVRRCPICWPLHNQPESKWRAQFPDGPPAHTRCRCWTVLRYTKRKRES